MNNQNSQGEYISRFCWKCRYQNNFAASPICRNCGVYLKAANTLETKDEKEQGVNKSAAETSPVKLSAMIILTAVLLVCGGVLYIYFAGSQKTIETGASVELPPDAWHQASIWNLYRRNPTVGEILEKNIQAIFKTGEKIETQTLFLKGNLSFARLGCYTEQCLLEEYKRELAAVQEHNRRVLASGDGSQQVKNAPQLNVGTKPPLDDEFDKPAYEKAGGIEIHIKNPNRIWQKSDLPSKDETGKRIESTQSFNGSKGWRKNTVVERENIVESNLVDLADAETEELKKTAAILLKQFFLKEENLKFSHRAKVNDAVHFAVEEGKDVLYFDSVTGYLSEIETDKMTCFLSSYADYGDRKLPSVLYFRIIDKSGNLVWMKFENLEWRINEAVEDSIFEKPV